jgi:hypothetical protein
MATNIPIFVQEVKGKTLYYASVAGKPIMLTRAKDFNNKIFWTSIPEGQLQLAMGINRSLYIFGLKIRDPF